MSVALGALMLILPVFEEISPVLVRLPLPALRLTLFAALTVPELVRAAYVVARLTAPELEIVPEFVRLLAALSDKSTLLFAPAPEDKSEFGNIDEITPPFSLVMSAAAMTPAVLCLATSYIDP